MQLTFTAGVQSLNILKDSREGNRDSLKKKKSLSLLDLSIGRHLLDVALRK